jgi:hypothetical protein
MNSRTGSDESGASHAVTAELMLAPSTTAARRTPQAATTPSSLVLVCPFAGNRIFGVRWIVRRSYAGLKWLTVVASSTGGSRKLCELLHTTHNVCRTSRAPRNRPRSVFSPARQQSPFLRLNKARRPASAASMAATPPRSRSATRLVSTTSPARRSACRSRGSRRRKRRSAGRQ